MARPSPTPEEAEQQRLKWLRFGVPTMLFGLVMGFEVTEHFLLSEQGINTNFIIESLMFGVVSPLMVYVALGWLLQLYMERHQAALSLRQLNEALQRRDALLHRLLQQTMNAQEEERRRLARQLHDEFAQSLMAFQLSLNALLPYLKNVPDELAEEIRRAHHLSDAMLHQARQLMLDLRPPPLDELGLAAALRDLAARILEPHGVQVQVTRRGAPVPLDASSAIALYRIGQECLMNVLKHAQATNVQVTLTYDDERLILEVHDNGRGFDPQMLSEPDEQGGWGLLGMEERCTLLGGTMHLDSTPGRGTHLRFEFPLAGIRA